MTLSLKCAAIIAAFLSITAHTFAQQDAIAKRKAELLREVLKEKMHDAFSDDDDAKPATAAKTTATDIKVTSATSSGSESEIALAYKPTDSNKMVISFMRSSGGLSFPIYYSSNGGATWTQSNFNSITRMAADFPGHSIAGGGDPVFAWDKTGRLYFSWIYLTATSFSSDTGYFTLSWAYSDDDGHTWQVKPNHFIGQGMIDFGGSTILPFKDGITDRQWMAVDNTSGPFQGNVYCSYVCFPPGAGTNFHGVKVMVPGVDTFGAAVSAHSGFTQFGNVAVDTSGKLHLSLFSYDDNDIKHTLSSDGGLTFGPAIHVGDVVDGDPSSFILHNRENAATNMAIDGTSGTGQNVHIVWSDFGSGAMSYYSRSTDGGATWSTPLNLNTLLEGRAGEMPTVAVNGDRVSISLTAIETMPGASNYYVLNSFDNGSSFGAPVLLSSASTDYVGIGAPSSGSSLFFGDYTQSQRSTCMVYSAWADGRSSTPKVYFSRHNSCSPVQTKDVTLVNHDIQLVNLFPNPAKDNLMLLVNSGRATRLLVQIADMTGKVVYQHQYALKEGQQQLSVPVSALAYGNYVVKISNNKELIATRNVVAGK